MAESVDDDGRSRPDVDLPDVDFVTLQPGQTIGRYRVVAVLGQGGFGITYRAVDTELGREVAIKEYLPTALAVRKDGVTVVPRSRSAAEDLAWGLERFVSEGRTLAALHRAPGIVKVHDYLQANGTAYLVMELVDGETLHERIARAGPLDAAEIDRILAPLLDGLEQVHAAGFLHRDIKPANILLDAKGQPTLIDFGASRVAIAGRTQAMTAVFTPGYAPVEQFTSAPQGAWTDIYSLAATLYHALTGEPPLNAIDRMVDDELVPLAGSGRAFPKALLAGIDAALVVRAAGRPQSVAAWRVLLTGSGGAAAPATVVMAAKSPASPSLASSPLAGTPSTSPRGAHAGMKIAAAAAAAALLLVAAGGWFALGSGVPPSTRPPPSSASPSPMADQAQEELERARREQRTAQEEAARLRAEAEARRKADEEAALRTRIEQELREKAAAEEAARQKAAADARRQAEAQAAADAAAKAKPDAEADAKAREEAAARLRAEEADRKGAEAAETALRLSHSDRQRLQVALTSLGFSTGGTDGVFGVRSREMIAAWQKKAGQAATGYLTHDQQATLQREAATALARYDEEQKKLALAAAAPAVAPPASGPAAPPASPSAAAPAASGRQCEGTYRSQWCRAAYQGFPPSCWYASMTIRNGEISDGWVSQADATKRNVVSGRIDAAGNVFLTYEGIGQQTHVNQRFVAQMSGRVANGLLTAAGRGGTSGRDFNVTVRCR
ncbi:serine/threonine-protein kinase [Reyranella massiliensis]|uniref:serine/threonine-protein kinase n=1 Tax=Reyranella massiliensis TaxID=445220 RepID=UPI0006ACFAC2|nr:serine/threonine-protein kinase [Reyranella massiliensis]